MDLKEKNTRTSEARQRITPHDGNTTSEISGLEQSYKKIRRPLDESSEGPIEYAEISNKLKYILALSRISNPEDT